MINILEGRLKTNRQKTVDILGGPRALASLSRREIIEGLRANWLSVLARANTLPVKLPGAIKLLGSSRKIQKSMEVFENLYSVVTYLAPAGSGFQKGSSRTLCPWSSRGDISKGEPNCEVPCLGLNSGRMRMSDSQKARLWKTALWVSEKSVFREPVSYTHLTLPTKA